MCVYTCLATSLDKMAALSSGVSSAWQLWKFLTVSFLSSWQRTRQVDAPRADGATALHLSAANGCATACWLLLGARACADRAWSGVTPLSAAALGNHAAAAKVHPRAEFESRGSSPKPHS